MTRMLVGLRLWTVFFVVSVTFFLPATHLFASNGGACGHLTWDAPTEAYWCLGFAYNCNFCEAAIE